MHASRDKLIRSHLSLAAATSLQRHAERKSLAAGTAGSPRRRRPARRRQRARRQSPRCTRCAALCSLSLCTSCKQLQHFHVGQPPIIQRLCTWAVHVGLCMGGVASRPRGNSLRFFCVANASAKGSPRHGQCLLTCCCWLLLLVPCVLRCLLRCFTFACFAGFIFALSLSSSFLLSLSLALFSLLLSLSLLLSCLARSQRGSQLQCAA